MSKKIDELEGKTFYKEDFEALPPSDIVAYNELRSCADLYRMYSEKILDIKPDFQRDIIWKPADQTRFIDSLIKQLPIPSMCFSLDYTTQRWLVIDGLQRMATIIKFLSNRDWRLSKLEDIDPKISGKKVAEMMDKKSELHQYYSRVENLSLPITILRCDYSKKSHTNYLFVIFHRLNAGGMRLNNQEIRNCIYGGPFNKLLKELNENIIWRKINKMKAERSYRFTKIELILRFFAFEEKYLNYIGKLAKFLNNYMDNNKDMNAQNIEKKRKLFERTVKYIYEDIMDEQPPSRLGITVLEALMFGVAKNLGKLEDCDKRHAKKLFDKLNNHDSFSEDNLKEGLSSKEKVQNRLSTAKKIFSN